MSGQVKVDPAAVHGLGGQFGTIGQGIGAIAPHESAGAVAGGLAGAGSAAACAQAGAAAANALESISGHYAAMGEDAHGNASGYQATDDENASRIGGAGKGL